MPLSLVIALKTDQAIPQEHLGRQAQAWFLRQVERFDPDYSAAVHDQQGPKPYTVSGLIHLTNSTRSGKWLRERGECGLRVTVFDERLEEIVCRRLLANLPAALKLWWVEFKLEAVFSSPKEHPLAGQTSFAALVQSAECIERDEIVRLSFASPTSFRSDGIDIPLPIPVHVFRSYWLRWNAYAPEPLRIHELWPQFVESCVVVRELHQLNTERWVQADGARGAVTGFTGQAAYQLLSPRLRGDWQTVRQGAGKVMQTLAAFAPYCGTGHHTTIGFGQTQLLDRAGREVLEHR